jgi:hypothetical protein
VGSVGAAIEATPVQAAERLAGVDRNIAGPVHMQSHISNDPPTSHELTGGFRLLLLWAFPSGAGAGGLARAWSSSCKGSTTRDFSRDIAFAPAPGPTAPGPVQCPCCCCCCGKPDHDEPTCCTGNVTNVNHIRFSVVKTSVVFIYCMVVVMRWQRQ